MKTNYFILGLFFAFLIAMPLASSVAPVLVNLTTADNDQDGTIDRLIAEFDQNLTGNDSGLGFTIVGNGCTLSSANQTAMGIMTFIISCNSGTSATPTLEYDANDGANLSTSGGSSPADDLLSFGPNTSIDGAHPVVFARLTRDTDSDGKLDRILIWFSETVNSTSSTDGVNVTVAGYDVLNYSLGGAYLNVTINESSSFDTDATPDVYLENAGNITDLRGLVAINDSSAQASADSAAPVLHTVRISSNNTNSSYANVGQNISIFINASEPIFSVVVNISGRVANLTGVNYTRYANISTYSTDAEGLITFRITFQDNSVYTVNTGTPVNSTTDGSYVIFDKSAPVVSITSPTSGNRTSINTTSVLFSFSDSFSPVASCSLLVNNTVFATNFSVTNSTSTTLANTTRQLSDGTYNLTVNCTDIAGNTNSSDEISVIIERTAPALTTISTSGTSATGSSGTLTVTATTDENATCYYNATAFNASDGAGGTTALSGSATSHTFDVVYASSSTLGPYFISCIDTAGNGMSSSNSTGSISVTLTASSSGGGGGGGGGGGASSSLNPNSQKSWSSIKPGATQTMTITRTDLGVKLIELEVNTPANNVKLTVEKLPSKPTSTSDAGSKVYRYLSITKQNLNDDQLNGTAKIRFSVENSWMSQNGVAASDIVLKRYASGSWSELKTTIVSTGSSETTFDAETPGFSYFAIAASSIPKATGVKTTTPPSTTQANDTVNEAVGSAEETPVVEGGAEVEAVVPVVVESEKTPMDTKKVVLISVTALVVLLLVALGFFFMNKAKKMSKRE